MPKFLSVLVTAVLVCWLGPAESEPPGERPTDADVHRVEGPNEKGNAHRAHEILGPGLGEFIFISGGEFTMGCNQGENDDERPEHVVRLSSFFVGKTPVTNSQFVRFLNEARVKPSEYLYSKVSFGRGNVMFIDGKWNCGPGTEDQAACGENWILAERYCVWLSAKTGRKCRLPTEAEWEYVCRGKEGRKFPWGNNEDALESKVWEWRTRRMVPVGSFPKGATPEGVCDLVGYMDEMCSDWYDPEYYAKSPTDNPQGPSEPRHKNQKVTRGGLEHRYGPKGIIGRILRESESFAILPSTYLPRGWSRERSAPTRDIRFVDGRIGFRVVVEPENGTGVPVQ